ncbi:Tetratricopeptide repeat-containing protein [Desulfofustis glycolicus DSM 9705]|uniref:Tetratricopeptide repeat-containing protein n=2 Tax=Desulfofustis glycolicus TaxID=51195 RepID=A0A1M5YTE0_9BACT|nr:Tetratricopeptide repeat-containing protein [Desulfofustis glycolicus DSM 9705]
MLSTCLWAINPIQTQAVTYIVQRMASMAAMFFIISIYHYVLARQTQVNRQTILHLILCVIFFLLALGCKENAVTLIPTLLLLELCFFKRNDRAAKIILAILVGATIFFFLAAFYYAIDRNLLQSFSEPIGSRPFSVKERLLTQPAILLLYLSLLFYPSPARLSIDHSFPLSTSLFQPWTTLPSILIVLILIVFAIIRFRKNPLLSFAILFFFINHIIESTIIPLELIFEHRNYLPSFFLFLPVAAGIRYLLNWSASSMRLVHAAIIVVVPLLLIMLGLATYTRNSAWASEESLWADALTKAPNNARPFAKLGEIYGWQKEKTPENLHTAVILLRKALERESPRTSFEAAIIGNIGKVYMNYGLLDQAVHYFQESVQQNPNFTTSRFDLAQVLTLQGNFTEALEQINLLIEENDQQGRFYNLRAMILLWLNRPDEAAHSAQQAMPRAFVNKQRYFYNIGVALSKAGHLDQGLWFLKRASQTFPQDRRILCSLIENRLLVGDRQGARQYSLQLLSGHGIVSLVSFLEQARTDYAAVPINVDLIKPVIVQTAMDTITDLNRYNSDNQHDPAQ